MSPVGAGNLVRGAHQDFRSACPDGKDEAWRSPCLHGLRSCAPAGPTRLEQARGPGHRGCRTAPRGCRLAAPGDAARSSLAGPGRACRAEPGALDGSSEAPLRPARDSAPMASGSGSAEVDLRTPTAWATRAAHRHRLLGYSPGPGEPDLGTTADSRGTGRHWSRAGAVDRVGHSAPARSRARTAAIRSDLGGVPQGAGDNHAGLRLLHR